MRENRPAPPSRAGRAWGDALGGTVGWSGAVAAPLRGLIAVNPPSPPVQQGLRASDAHTHTPAERLGLALWPAQASMRAVQPFR